jgi:hypothetical protein
VRAWFFHDSGDETAAPGRTRYPIPGVGFPDADKSFLDYLRKYSSEEILDGESIEIEINKEWCLEDFETRLGER